MNCDSDEKWSNIYRKLMNSMSKILDKIDWFLKKKMDKDRLKNDKKLKRFFKNDKIDKKW